MCKFCCCIVYRVYFREEIAAKEAKLSDQSHLDADEQHHAWAVEQMTSLITSLPRFGEYIFCYQYIIQIC